MKYFVTEASIIFLLCFVELFKVVSSDRMDIIDNFIGLAEPNNNEIEKRNSIVDGGVFVPYKSTTIVHKSRLVPVTYGFVIKKETLEDNPALYKLGVKLLDEKVESTPKHIKLDEKKVEQAKILTENQSKLNDQQLEAKSNCVKGSKVLRLLAKLSKDINKIEMAILAQNQSVESEQGRIIAKSLKKEKEIKKLHPQNEAHVSGHKGVFEELNIMNKKPQTQYISKNLSRYWQCRRSHTKKKCAVFLLIKDAHNGHHRVKHPARYVPVHHYKHHRRHRKKHERHYLNKHNDKKHSSHDNVDKHNETTKHPEKHDETKHKVRHVNNGKNQDKHNNSTIHSARHKSHQKRHRKHQAKSESHLKKHLFGYESHEGEQLDGNNNDLKRHPFRYKRRKGKKVKKKKQNKSTDMI